METTTINIRHVHGSDLTGHIWGTIQVSSSEWKNSDGTPWTEPPPGIKKKDGFMFKQYSVN